MKANYIRYATQIATVHYQEIKSTLARWLITDEVPGPTGAVCQVMLALVHLRHIDGQEPADLEFLGATHELMLLRMDHRVRHKFANGMQMAFTGHSMMSVQLELPNDAIAERVTAALVQGVVAGHLEPQPQPDSRALAQWGAAIQVAVDRLCEEFDDDVPLFN